MADEPRKPTLEELFAKIAPHAPEPKKPDSQLHGYWRIVGKRKAYKFAALYVKHNFNAIEAYKELMADGGHKWRGTSRERAMVYLNSEWVSKYIREIIQKLTERALDEGGNELEQMLEINRLLIHADIFDLVEQVREYVPGRVGKDGVEESGTYKMVTRLKPFSQLTRQERLCVHKIRFHKTGEIASLEAYNRLDVQRSQVSLIELLKAKGGSDTDWNTDFRQRITDARAKAIDYEISRSGGKVVKIGAASK